MKFQTIFFVASALSLIACANSSKAPTTPETEAAPAVSKKTEEAVPEEVARKSGGFLICKAKKSRFHYDWRVGSMVGNGQELVDQNSIRYEFKSANRPAGDKGQHLKVGECGWAEQPLVAKKAKKVSAKSQVMFKSLSDEATQTFYKLKTGKVFTVPVRQTKNGMMAAPGSGIVLVR